MKQYKHQEFDEVKPAHFIVVGKNEYSYFEHLHSSGRKALNEYYAFKDHESFKDVHVCKICAKTGKRIKLIIND